MIIQAETLALPGVRHAFFTRRGGVSAGVYASLNGGIGSRDSANLVTDNRARMAAALGVGPDRLLTAYQIHSPHVVTIEAPWTSETRPRADAIVTRSPRAGRRRDHGRLRTDPLCRPASAASSVRLMPAGAGRLPASSRQRSMPWSGSAPSAGRSAPSSAR